MRTKYFADKYKDVVKLREREKKTFKEIGKTLGVSSCSAEAAYKKEKRFLEIESQVATSSEDDWTRLPVSTRTKNCLFNSLHRHPQIKKINDFASLTLLDIQQFRNIGKVSVNELVSVLKNYGVNLKNEELTTKQIKKRGLAKLAGNKDEINVLKTKLAIALEDSDPEYMTSVAVYCGCGNMVQFELPVN